jgi:thioredoxin-like negative regulator of GroEL
MIKTIGSSDFAAEVLAENAGRVTVFFYSDLIEACAAQEQIIEEVNSEHDSMMTFVRIKYEDNVELANSYGIMYGNVYIYFTNGKEVSKFEKVSSKESLIKRISLDHDYSHMDSL